MKITDIKQQVKIAGRYSIFVDGKYAFSLSDTALLEQKLYTGLELDAAEVKRLKQASSDDKLYGLVLRYVALRPRSEWEIHTYLERKKAPAPLVEEILNKLSKSGLINDVAFAEAWVNSRRLLKPSSRRKIFQELLAKHVSEAVIRQVLEEDETDERTVLRDLIAKRRHRYRDDLKLMQYLARQGFKYDDIKAELQANEDEV